MNHLLRDLLLFLSSHVDVVTSSCRLVPPTLSCCFLFSWCPSLCKLLISFVIPLPCFVHIRVKRESWYNKNERKKRRVKSESARGSMLYSFALTFPHILALCCTITRQKPDTHITKVFHLLFFQVSSSFQSRLALREEEIFALPAHSYLDLLFELMFSGAIFYGNSSSLWSRS